jgi:hypothetical protein
MIDYILPGTDGIFEIFFSTFRLVMWSTNCSGAPNTRFSSISFDSLRHQYILMGVPEYGPGRTFYLTEAAMRAGNCSALDYRFTSDPTSYYYGGSEYIPTLDVVYISYSMDSINSAYVIDMTPNTSQASNWGSALSGGNWWYDTFITGDYYWQSNGTLWAMGDEYGPGMSLLYQIELGNNFTALRSGRPVNGTGMRTILPRTLRALANGPTPTAPMNKWRTGFSGSIVFTTPDNDLMEVNIDTPAIRNITRLSQNVVALESFGSWDQIYAVVNGSTGASFARVNITTGALTTVAALPGLFQSLTRSGDGKMLAMLRESTNGNVTVVQITSTGSVSQVARTECPDSDCNKAWSDGTYLYFAPTPSDRTLHQRNFSSPDVDNQSLDLLTNCVDLDAEGRYGCSVMSNQFTYNGIQDLTYYAPDGGMLWAMGANDRITMLLRQNVTSNRWKPVVDFHHLVSDMAYFQYDRSWCNNRGSWNGEMCVCDNVAILGTRCETVLPAPVAPPVAAPVAAPVATPTASPVAGSGAPKSTTPVVAAASSLVVSAGSFVMMVCAVLAL